MKNIAFIVLLIFSSVQNEADRLKSKSWYMKNGGKKNYPELFEYYDFHEMILEKLKKGKDFSALLHYCSDDFSLMDKWTDRNSGYLYLRDKEGKKKILKTVNSRLNLIYNMFAYYNINMIYENEFSVKHIELSVEYPKINQPEIRVHIYRNPVTKKIEIESIRFDYNDY